MLPSYLLSKLNLADLWCAAVRCTRQPRGARRFVWQSPRRSLAGGRTGARGHCLDTSPPPPRRPTTSLPPSPPGRPTDAPHRRPRPGPPRHLAVARPSTAPSSSPSPGRPVRPPRLTAPAGPRIWAFGGVRGHFGFGRPGRSVGGRPPRAPSRKSISRRFAPFRTTLVLGTRVGRRAGAPRAPSGKLISRRFRPFRITLVSGASVGGRPPSPPPWPPGRPKRPPLQSRFLDVLSHSGPLRVGPPRPPGARPPTGAPAARAPERPLPQSCFLGVLEHSAPLWF